MKVSCIFYIEIKKIKGNTRPYEVGVIANKADLHSEFREADFNKLHGSLGISFYEEVSLKEGQEKGDDEIDPPVEVLKHFIRGKLF